MDNLISTSRGRSISLVNLYFIFFTSRSLHTQISDEKSSRLNQKWISTKFLNGDGRGRRSSALRRVFYLPGRLGNKRCSSLFRSPGSELPSAIRQGATGHYGRTRYRRGALPWLLAAQARLAVESVFLIFSLKLMTRWPM